MYVHIKKLEVSARRPISTKSVPAQQTGVVVAGQVYYTIDVKLDIIDTQVNVQKLMDEARLRLPKFLISLVYKGNMAEVEMIDDERAEFILHQYSYVMELIEEKKFDVAVAYFKLTEKIYPEYQINPRFDEINSLRNMTWDNLAKRGLI